MGVGAMLSAQREEITDPSAKKHSKHPNLARAAACDGSPWANASICN
jgi:hypothetical protein